MRIPLLPLIALAALAPAAGQAAPAPKLVPDAVAAASDDYRVVFENDQLRLLEHTLAVGAIEPNHGHPCRVSYAMSAFKTVTQRPGMPRQETVRQPRTAWWSPAEEHTEKNNGNAVARELIFEFKQPLAGVADCGSAFASLAVVAIPPSGLSWSVDPATKAAYAPLHGDPAKDGPFVQRVKLPAGARAAAHSHDRELSATILSGEVRVRIGDLPVQVLPAGSFLRIPAGVVHEEWTDGGVEYERRGVGPMSTTPAAK